MSPPKRSPKRPASKPEAEAPPPLHRPGARPGPRPAPRPSTGRPGKPDRGLIETARRTVERARPPVGLECRLDRQAGRLGREHRHDGRAGGPRGQPAGRPLDCLRLEEPPGPRRARLPVHRPGDLRPVPLARVDRDAAPREPRGPDAPGLAARLRPRSTRPARSGPARSDAIPSGCFAYGGAPNWTTRGEGLEAAQRGPDRLGRPLAALPRLAPRPPPAPPGRRLAQGQVPGLPPDVADALAALGPRPGDGRAGPLGPS